MEPTTFTLLIFLLTFLLIITELVHKTLAALLGAFLMIVYGFVNYSEIGSLIDFQAMGVIFGMMIVIEVVKDSGIFQFFGLKAIKLARGNPKYLFIIMITFTTILSAFLNNLTSILIMSALTFTLCRSLELNPLPFIISESIATNIGGIMFLTSSIPNILVAGAGDLTFMDFILFSLPLSFILFISTILFLLFFYRTEFKGHGVETITNFDEWSVIPDKRFFWNSLILLIFTIVFFMVSDKLGVTIDFVAISSAILILLLSGADPDETLKHIDWGTIFFFLGLFIVVGGLENSGALKSISNTLISFTGNNKMLSTIALLWVSGLSSGIVDNIPITVTLIPIARHMIHVLGVNALWWCIVFGANLGGNLTPMGSPSNIIALGIAKKEGYEISFSEFMKVSTIVTCLHLSISTLYLLLRFFVS